MSISLDIKKTVTVQAKEVRMHLKVCDNFTASLNDQDGAEICAQEDGYVPGFMPGEHYGDYVILNIDLETGLVTNWNTPSTKKIVEWVEQCRGAEQ